MKLITIINLKQKVGVLVIIEVKEQKKCDKKTWQKKKSVENKQDEEH